jgi:hypothetical protein
MTLMLVAISHGFDDPPVAKTCSNSPRLPSSCSMTMKHLQTA